MKITGEQILGPFQDHPLSLAHYDEMFLGAQTPHPHITDVIHYLSQIPRMKYDASPTSGTLFRGNVK